MSLALLVALACADPEAVVARAANPLLAIDRAVDRSPFEGTVHERLDAGPYVYLRIDDRWVTGLDHGLQVGDRARVEPVGLARDFVSVRTQRRFDQLWFAVVRAP
jgi:hypothetical protein